MTQDVRYALIFLAEIAKQSGQGPVTVKKIATAHHLSFKFLEQIVGKLRLSGILWVSRGRNGGYGLNDGKILSLADIYLALGRKIDLISCHFPSDCHGGAECVQKEIEAKLVGITNDSLSGLEVSHNAI
ncbi:Rrf2 family transcriptional regulator [Candidatus Collierbacteria bacterium]|nr:Rrf2 family transcriptional regulator [Candidatus Collierbacteria bacterium]